MLEVRELINWQKKQSGKKTLKLPSIYKIRDTKLSVETDEQTEAVGLESEERMGDEIDASHTHHKSTRLIHQE